MASLLEKVRVMISADLNRLVDRGIGGTSQEALYQHHIRELQGLQEQLGDQLVSLRAELNQMRERMQRLRVKLAEAIRRKSNSKDFDFIAEHSGMFSLLGLPQDVVEKLKKDDAVYMINDSRINVAGIPEDRIDELADYLIAAAG